MEKNKRAYKITPDEETQTILKNLIKEIKDNEKFVKITPSKLVSWIIKKYYPKNLNRDMSIIAKDHFNSKEYLKFLASNIKGGTSLENVLKIANNEIIKGKRKKE